MSTEPQRTCPRCGNELPEATEFCPICMLRKGLAGGVESGESSASEDTVPTAPDQTVQRFEHYELVTGEDGKPVELGRGAMGVTYKAFDVDLHCPVTLNRRGFVFCAKPRGGERSSPECCVGLPSGQNRRELLLRDGVCRRGNAREPHQRWCRTPMIADFLSCLVDPALSAASLLANQGYLQAGPRHWRPPFLTFEQPCLQRFGPVNSQRQQ
jgi:hypothetical protein